MFIVQIFPPLCPRLDYSAHLKKKKKGYLPYRGRDGQRSLRSQPALTHQLAYIACQRTVTALNTPKCPWLNTYAICVTVASKGLTTPPPPPCACGGWAAHGWFFRRFNLKYMYIESLQSMQSIDGAHACLPLTLYVLLATTDVHLKIKLKKGTKIKPKKANFRRSALSPTGNCFMQSLRCQNI